MNVSLGVTSSIPLTAKAPVLSGSSERESCANRNKISYRLKDKITCKIQTLHTNFKVFELQFFSSSSSLAALELI